jgi:Ca2+-binding EF-hand superfamily protein
MTMKTGTLAALAALATTLAGEARAQSMTPAERQLMIENMLQADSNNDGAINRSEFEALMQLNANDNLGASGMVVRTGAYDRAFGRLDANGDGLLTREEAQELAAARG